MEQVVEDSYGSQQLASRLLEIFGGTALVLCITGIYGLLAYLVIQRTRELGIRIALGEQRVRLMAMVLRQAGGMLMAGLAAGLLLAYVTSRVVGTLLYGVKPQDPVGDGGSDADSVDRRPGGRVHPGTSCSRCRSDSGSAQRVNRTFPKRVTRRAVLAR
jgi:ABC-type antimicrobial peptide transport system permease subunit